MLLIGMVAAMTQESAALLRHVAVTERVSIGSFHGSRFEYAGKTFVLVTSGMGLRRARQATQYLLQAYSPGVLISFGIAGAVEESLQVGDVVLAESVCQFSHGILGSPVPINTWPETARSAIRQRVTDIGYSTYTGTAITFVGSQATLATLGNLPHPILEMETAGIAQAAMQNRVPLISLRAISDGPCAPIPFDLGEVMDDDANLRVGRLLQLVFRKPSIIYRSVHILQNNRRAQESAASALLAALSHDDFGINIES